MKTAKNLKFTLVFLVLFLLSSLDLLAQSKTDQIDTPRLKHAVGIGAGFTTGYGLSYRYTPSEWGFQVNFAPYKVKDYEQYSFGITFLYELVKLKGVSLYAYEGNHYLYVGEKNVVIGYSGGYNTPPYYYPMPIYGSTSSAHWNNGIGFGVSALASENISFEFMAGYAYYVDFTQIKPTIEAAMYFKF